MPSSSPYRDPYEDPSEVPDPHGRVEYAPAPRWVRVLGVAAVVLVLVFLAVHLAGGGLGRHAMP